MNLKTDIMKVLAINICEYLRLDEDLFFCGGHICQRVAEGRKYFCYLAVQDYGISARTVKGFLGYSNQITVSRHHKNLKTGLKKLYSTQMVTDIEGIRGLCKDLLKAA